MKTMKQGFTLIELMIVVAIIGILAAIAIPKFADLINKAKEGSTKGALSSVRSAIQVYYGDNEGWFPAVEEFPLTCLITNAKYMAEIPIAKMPGTTHGDVKTVVGELDDATAGWLYFNDSASAVTWGNFVVNCTHEDIKGRTIAASTPWSTF